MRLIDIRPIRSLSSVVHVEQYVVEQATEPQHRIAHVLGRRATLIGWYSTLSRSAGNRAHRPGKRLSFGSLRLPPR
jgi:hypothetical protein